MRQEQSALSVICWRKYRLSRRERPWLPQRGELSAQLTERVLPFFGRIVCNQMF